MEKVWVVQYIDGGDPGIIGVFLTKIDALHAVRECILDTIALWELPEERMTQPSDAGSRITWFFSTGTGNYTMYWVTEHACKA